MTREEEGGYFEHVSENGKRGCGEFGRKVHASGTLGAWAEVAGGDWRCDMPGSWAFVLMAAMQAEDIRSALFKACCDSSVGGELLRPATDS